MQPNYKKSSMKSGFLRVAAVAPRVNVGDIEFNLQQITRHLESLESKGVEIAVFPEMSITGYTCGDLFLSRELQVRTIDALARLKEISHDMNIHFIVGLPIATGTAIYNCAALVRNGNIDIVSKTYIPNYGEFYERRWWRAARESVTMTFPELGGDIEIKPGGCVFESHGSTIGIEICEDLWTPIPPSSHMSLKGADVIFNLSASDDYSGKYDYLKSLIGQQSGRCRCAYVYSSAGYGESSTDLVFTGKTIIAEEGIITKENNRWNPDDNTVIADIDIEAIRADRRRVNTFADCASYESASPAIPDLSNSTDEPGESDLMFRDVNPTPFLPHDKSEADSRCSEIINIQVAALAKRLSFINCRSLVVGISGGLDSTLALLVAVRTFDRLGFDRKGITGVTMPGFGTTGRTYTNALTLMRTLGITTRDISIVPAVRQHFKDICHDINVHDTTYENAQARQRTLLLMDIANQTNGIVLGTGDLSELALGWATYNGDQMSMYGINAGVPKTLVKYLVKWIASNTDNEDERVALLDIVDTPISPELIPADKNDEIGQKTEDLVGPYELHDFFIYYTLRYGFSPSRIYMLAKKAFNGSEYTPDIIKHWLKIFYRRFFSQQFKRSCMPDGPKVGSVCLSPRGDWRMPSDTSATLWLAEVEKL